MSEERGYDSSVFRFVDIQEEEYKNKLIGMYVAQPGRFLKRKALARRMQDPLYYAMVMQAVEEAEVTFAGIDNTTGDVLLAGQMIIGMQPGISTISSIGLCDIPGLRAAREVFWQWETVRYVTNPNAEQLASIAISRVRHGKKLCSTGTAVCDGKLLYAWKRSGRTDRQSRGRL